MPLNSSLHPLLHQHIHQLSPFKEEHFKRWVELFKDTVDEMYAGEKTNLAKKRAGGIAQLMQLKMGEING